MSRFFWLFLFIYFIFFFIFHFSLLSVLLLWPPTLTIIYNLFIVLKKEEIITSHSHSHSHFSWTILSKGERCNEVNPMWSTNPTTADQTTTPGTTCPTLFDKCVGSLTFPANQETGTTVYSPYPRRRERLTICRCNYNGGIFSSVILRPWVLVRSGARTLGLPHSSPALYQLS